MDHKVTHNAKVSDPTTKSPILNTKEAAKSPGKLIKKAKLVSKAAIKTKLLQSLKECKVGTETIERQALKLAEDLGDRLRRPDEESNSKSKIQKIQESRNPQKVVDVLKLKEKYTKEAEDLARNEYPEEKKQLKKWYTEQGRELKFRIAGSGQKTQMIIPKKKRRKS